MAPEFSDNSPNKSSTYPGPVCDFCAAKRLSTADSATDNFKNSERDQHIHRQKAQISLKLAEARLPDYFAGQPAGSATGLLDRAAFSVCLRQKVPDRRM